jgi:hypothetical protein
MEIIISRTAATEQKLMNWTKRMLNTLSW